MSELAELTESIFATLKKSVEDFKDEVKDGAVDFLKEKAAYIAKETLRLKTGDDENKKVAKQNLKHLAAQVQGEVIRLELAATKRAADLLGKIVSVLSDALGGLIPKLFGG